NQSARFLSRLARKPKWRILTKPRGSTCSRKRRINSNASRVMVFCLLPCAESRQPKSNLTVFEAKQSTVGDGDAVSVMSQVLNDMPRARKGLLGVDDPVFIFERPGKSIESSGILKGRQRSAEFELAPTKRAPEESEELSPELSA